MLYLPVVFNFSIQYIHITLQENNNRLELKHLKYGTSVDDVNLYGGKYIYTIKKHTEIFLQTSK
jgi:hypothetical protein